MKKSILLLLSVVFVGILNPLFANGTEPIRFRDLREERDVQTNVPIYLLKNERFTGTTRDEIGNKGVIFESYFVNGIMQKQLGWYANGNREREMFLKDGRAHGKFIVYFEDGERKAIEENYNNGILDGMQYGWNSDGSLRYQEQRIDGVILSRFDYEKKGEWVMGYGC